MAIGKYLSLLIHPYYVTKMPLSSGVDARIGWEITEKWRRRAIRLKILTEPRQLMPYNRAPWDVTYDHQLVVSIPRLRSNIVASINSYLAALRRNQTLRANFATCMLKFYPPG